MSDLDVPRSDRAMATLFGLPLYTSEVVPRGGVIQARFNDRETLHMHPQSAEALALSMLRDKPFNDPQVQLDASLTWIKNRIARRADAALKRLDDLVLAASKRDARRSSRHDCVHANGDRHNCLCWGTADHAPNEYTERPNDERNES